MLYFGLIGILGILQIFVRQLDAWTLPSRGPDEPYSDSTFEFTKKGYTFFVKDHYVNRITPPTVDFDAEYVNLTDTMCLVAWLPGLFNFTENTKVLDLSNNFIYWIEENSLKDFKKLESLNLSNNHLEIFIGTLIFSNLITIRHLDLTNNDILQLYPSNFFGLGNQTDILISGNRISLISTWLFEEIKDEYDLQSHRFPDDNLVIGEDMYDENEIISAKVCIRNGTLESFENMIDNEALEAHCHNVILGYFFVKIFTSQRGIARFSKGWYRLKTQSEFELFFYENEITDLSSEILNDLPQDVRLVDLSGNKIKRLSRGSIMNYHLKQLKLSNNLISEIEDGAFENTNLLVLNLTGNGLKNLNFIATLPLNMSSLFVVNNQINEILPDTFSKLPKLEVLDLSGNNISEIKNNYFHSLTKIMSLDLSKNKIKMIEPGTFRNFGNLSFLDLHKNNLVSLQAGTFDGLELIGYIDLSFNHLTKITKDYFPNTLAINNLIMSDNQIEVLENETFPMKSLLSLVLRNNKIKKIERGTLKMKCNVLDLGNNLWSQPDEKIFEDISDLRSLNLENNDIQQIEKGFAKHFKDLHELDLSHNPIRTLNNSALFGLEKSKIATVKVINTPIELIQGGLFKDV